jgi:hypothetical protein
VNQPPARPVLVVEADPVKAKNAGLKVMRKALAAADMQVTPRATSNTTPLKTSILKKIRLNDDQEPWLLGAAEVYAVVAGVNPGRDEPVVDIVDMPYLDYDNTDYTPNQILVYWDRYRWGAVDVVMMEQDDNVNYKELSALFIDALKLGFTAGGVPEALPFLDLGGRIVKALPDSWMTNNDDYLDTFYTLEQDQSYHQYPGAAGNAVIDLEPRRSSQPGPDCRSKQKANEKTHWLFCIEPRIRPDLSASHPVCDRWRRSARSGSGYRSGNPSPLPDSAHAPDRWHAGSHHVARHLIVFQPFETLVHPARDLHVGETGKLGQGLVVGDRQYPRHDLGIDADGGAAIRKRR